MRFHKLFKSCPVLLIHILNTDSNSVCIIFPLKSNWNRSIIKRNIPTTKNWNILRNRKIYTTIDLNIYIALFCSGSCGRSWFVGLGRLVWGVWFIRLTWIYRIIRSALPGFHGIGAYRSGVGIEIGGCEIQMQSGTHTAIITDDTITILTDPAITVHFVRTITIIARRTEPPPNIPIVFCILCIRIITSLCTHRICIGTASASSCFIICTVVFCKSIACCRVCIIDFRFGEEEYFIGSIISSCCSVSNIIVICNICCFNSISLRRRESRIDKILSAVICLWLIHRCNVAIQPASHTACFPCYIFKICIILLVI